MTAKRSDQSRWGTAGWSILSQYRDEFPSNGSQLERYASRLNCVEINSSFHRPHQYKTYERWAASTPERFSFAVKIPKTISHAAGPDFLSDDLDRFLGEVAGLGKKLGILLLQLPPSASFDADGADRLFSALQNRSSTPIVCEPRHASWFNPEVDAWLADRKVARVAADPSRAKGGDEPGGWRELAYFRFHGSPKVYYSDYDEAALKLVRKRLDRLAAARTTTWCIFDNTASGAALGNALEIGKKTPVVS